MKKMRFILVFIFMLFIPTIVNVYADGVKHIYYTEILSEKVNAGEDIEYIVKYECTDTDYEFGNNKTLYVLFDSNKLQYKTFSEYGTSTGTKYNVSIVKDGVLKIEIDPTTVKAPFTTSVSIKFSTTNASTGSTIIELKTQYDYENLKCEDCDGFWMGEITKNNEKRTIQIEKVANNPDINNDSLIQPPKSEKAPLNLGDYITYISLAMNSILLVVIVVLLVKKKK